MRKTFFFLLLMASICLSAEPLVRVQQLGRQELLESVSALGKMTFTNDQIQVFGVGNELLLQIPLSEESVIEINADDSNVTITDAEGHSEIIGIATALDETKSVSVRVYPNPTTDYLYVSGLEAGKSIRIFTLKGEIVMDRMSDGQTQTLQVNALSNGAYLLQAGSFILKLIKQ